MIKEKKEEETKVTVQLSTEKITKKHLQTELRRGLIRDCLMKGVQSPAVIAATINEYPETIRKDIAYILEKEFRPAMATVDVQKIVVQSLTIYDGIVEEGWDEYNRIKGDGDMNPKSLKLLFDTIMLATEHKERLMERIGLLKNTTTESSTDVTRCKDCEYLKRAMECPLCSAYHRERLSAEGKIIDITPSKVEDVVESEKPIQMKKTVDEE